VKEDSLSPHGPQFQGRGEITNLRLRSASTKVELAPENVPFGLSSGQTSLISSFSAKSSIAKSFHQLHAGIPPGPNELHIEYGPFPVALGRPVPAQARGWVGGSGYAMVVRGDGDVSRILRMASMLGLQAVKASAEGAAQMDLQIGGSWTAGNAPGNPSGFSLPKVTGTVQLHNVRATVRGVNGPIEISTAELDLLPDEARVQNLSARAADAHWTGSLALPRGCGTPGACVVRFDLNADQIATSSFYEWLGSHPSPRRWYQILSSADPGVPSFLRNLRASGKVNAGHVRIHDVEVEKVSALVELERGEVKVRDLHADLLSGKYTGDWQADFTGVSPVYTGSGTLTGISLEQMASAMHDPWISGTGGGTYQFKASGTDSAEFWQSAEGGLRFDLRDGALDHISLANDDAPLRIVRWQGHAKLHDGKIEIAEDELDSPSGTYGISGTASLGQVLDFRLTAGPRLKATGTGALVYSITGTVAEPRVAVTPAPETQARLKP